MDKKNTIIGIAFLVAAFALMLTQGGNEQPRQPATTDQPTPTSTPSDLAGAPASGETPTTNPATPDAPASGLGAVVEDEPEEMQQVATQAPETLETLENDFIRVTFTSHGGAIKFIEITSRIVSAT